MTVQGMHGRVASTRPATARHRADRAPELVPHGRPGRRAHLEPRRHRTIVRAAIVLLAAALLSLAVVSRHFADDGTDRNDAVILPEPAAGTSVTVAVDGAGNVRVSVDVIRPAAPGHLLLTVPVRPGTGFRPQVTIGSLLGDSVPVPVEETLGAGAAVGLPTGVTRVAVDYTASGTYVASTPSEPGRGLVLLTPLRISGADPPGRLEVSDPRILNVGCMRDGEPRVCGTRDGDTWRVDGLRPGEDVVAQIDLGSEPTGSS